MIRHMERGETRSVLRAALGGSAGLRGTFVKLGGLEPIDCAALAGADFCVVDREHGALDEHTVFAQIAHARALGLPCLVRLPEVDAGAIGRWLDAGAAGVQIADVSDAATAAALVAAGRYPPAGGRGISPSQRDGAYGVLSVAELLGGAAGEPVLVAQIERELDAATLDAIAATGVDVLFVGPVDLAARIDPTGGPATERVVALLNRVGDRALRAGCAFGQHALAGGQIHPLATYVTVASDTTTLRAGLAAAIGAVR
jgi:4-hydroxy-2-oxoheptanedioate aldolase